VSTELATGLLEANPQRAAAADAIVAALPLPSGVRSVDVHNPATGEVLVAVPDADAEEALGAVGAHPAPARRRAALLV
jgi:acyl-CoA reductase-like NAD-dependent aldehyde dehydrogenase